MRRQQQKLDLQLKGMRWTRLKDANKLNLAPLTDLEALVSQYTTRRTARAWLYREKLRDILERKQINVATSPRLIAGLLYLQHALDLPDEDVVWQWVENPYWVRRETGKV